MRLRLLTSDELHDELVKAGVPVETCNADLFALVTAESRALMSRYKFAERVERFVHNVHKNEWFAIPLANKAWWARSREQAQALTQSTLTR